MDKGSVTTAAVISFTEALEDRSTTFYEEVMGRWPAEKKALQRYALDGEKYKTWVLRTYQETISDALEASYAFEGLDLDDYNVQTALDDDATWEQALEMALALEETACTFYRDVAERSASLLATIPQAFNRVVKRRRKREAVLQSLLDAERLAP